MKKGLGIRFQVLGTIKNLLRNILFLIPITYYLVPLVAANPSSPQFQISSPTVFLNGQTDQNGTYRLENRIGKANMESFLKSGVFIEKTGASELTAGISSTLLDFEPGSSDTTQEFGVTVRVSGAEKNAGQISLENDRKSDKGVDYVLDEKTGIIRVSVNKKLVENPHFLGTMRLFVSGAY